jgi:putative peptidoglycan lipid II flippase
LVRVLVVAAVLGTTFLGNTYQTANTVPNIVFELVAAGVLTAVLLPSLVRLLDGPDPGVGEHVARSVLGIVGAALAAIAVIGMVLAPTIMRALLSGAPAGDIRDDQVRVGTLLLRCFLPQLVVYAAGMVATGVLHARGSFALPAIAPAVNNVVVTATYVWFWLLTRGEAPGLDLGLAEQLVLGLGTTAGVVAFCALPVVAAIRGGVSLRPRFDARHPEVRRLARLGGWAVVQLAGTQLLLVVVLVLANGVEGGVVAYQLAFTVFLLPHAVVALPVATALYPVLARAVGAGDGRSFAAATGNRRGAAHGAGGRSARGAGGAARRHARLRRGARRRRPDRRCHRRVRAGPGRLRGARAPHPGVLRRRGHPDPCARAPRRPRRWCARHGGGCFGGGCR